MRFVYTGSLPMITAFLISQDYASFVSSNAIAVNYDSYGVQGHMAEQIQLRRTPETWLIFSCRTWLKLTGDRGGSVCNPRHWTYSVLILIQFRPFGDRRRSWTGRERGASMGPSVAAHGSHWTAFWAFQAHTKHLLTRSDPTARSGSKGSHDPRGGR